MTEPVFGPARLRGKADHLRRLRMRFATRTDRINIIKTVREGKIRDLFPSDLEWDNEFHGVPTANFIDIVARDLTEGIAPLPSLACVSGSMTHETDRKRAQRKNEIGSNYWHESNLQRQMFSVADQYVNAGFVAMYVEPDVDKTRPYICFFESLNTFYELDRYGDTVNCAHVIRKSVEELCVEFPGMDRYIKANEDGTTDNGEVLREVVLWIDGTSVTVFMPEKQGLVLQSYDHKLSRNPVRIIERPGFGRHPRGQFDDVVWVQVARAIMGILTLKAAVKAVEAPIALPDDVDELPVGPDATIQSANAQAIHRVDLTLPPNVFAESSTIDNELRLGSRYPDARTGELQASVVTGKGVEALLGTFDSQIRGDQMVFQEGLEYISSICFEMDEVWWPTVTKTVSGNTVSGSFEFTYLPQEFKGRWDCNVSYGFMTGLKPNQAIVSALQLAGAGLITKKTAVSHLPFDIDAEQEAQGVNTEAAREALKQGLFALVQSSGQIAAQGGDALSIIKLGVNAIKGIENGQAVETAIEAAYEQMQQEQHAAQQQAQAAQAQAQQGAAPGGGGPGGVQVPPDHIAPGQAGLPPGGLPTIENLVAGFRGNGDLPVSQVTIQQHRATGT